jgi:hypothetical protein
VVGDPLELADRLVHVEARAHGPDEQQPVAGRPEGVEQPPVVGPHAGVGHLWRVDRVAHVEEQVGRPVVAVEDELGGDAFAVHLGQPDVAVPRPRPLPGAVDAVGVEHVVVAALDHALVDEVVVVHRQHRRSEAAVLLGQAGQERVELLLEVLRPQRLGHDRVPVGRHQQQPFH